MHVIDLPPYYGINFTYNILDLVAYKGPVVIPILLLMYLHVTMFTSPSLILQPSIYHLHVKNILMLF